MKKVFYAILALPLLWACNVSGGSQEITEYINILTKVAITNHLENTAETWEMQYGNLGDDKIATNYQFSTPPVLKKQIINSANPTQLNYSYELKGSDIFMTVSEAGVPNRTFSFDGNGMADKIFLGGAFVPYTDVTYDNMGYRKNAYGAALTLDNAYNYKTAKDEQDSAEYEYSYFPNYGNIQQSAIPGESYMWMTGMFGRQSSYLLSKASMTIEGLPVVLTYEYKFDDNRYVTQEKISTNGVVIATIDYTWQLGVITYRY